MSVAKFLLFVALCGAGRKNSPFSPPLQNVLWGVCLLLKSLPGRWGIKKCDIYINNDWGFKEGEL